MKRLLQWITRKWDEADRQRMAREFPVTAWASQFDSAEELGAAIARGEGPGVPHPR